MMGRDPRYLPRPGALVEITQRTFQGRYLLRPSPRTNALALGCLARAQQNTGAKVHGLVFLSSHFHLLCSFRSVEQMSDFMCQLKTSLSIEIGHLHDWPGATWGHRYRSIPVSDEPAAQLARLDYVLEHGCKEGLVMSPRDWPGVHCAKALARGRPLEGLWIDRTSFHQALNRGEEAQLSDFEQRLEVSLEKLPCLAHESAESWRHLVAERIEAIEEKTRQRHRRDGTAPLGATAVLRTDPTQRPKKLEGSAPPRFHAYARAVRLVLVGGYRQFLAAYRAAADQLAGGYLGVQFPENCYPPRLAFVAPSPPEPG